jgi:hypothetical protein
MKTPVAMVRCRLDASQSGSELRYIPAYEFELWQHLMVSKYGRPVVVEEVSVWVPDKADVWDDGIDADLLQAVTRIRFEKPGPQSTVIPVVRYLATETYREAKSALLSHFDLRCRWGVEVTPGYFVSAGATATAADHETDLESADSLPEPYPVY